MITTKNEQSFIEGQENQKEAMLKALNSALERVNSGETTGLLMVMMGSPVKEQIDAGVKPDAIAMQVFSGYPRGLAFHVLQVLNQHIQETLVPLVMDSAEVLAVLIPVGGSPEDSSDKAPESPRSH